jgi:hypothetical protein
MMAWIKFQFKIFKCAIFRLKMCIFTRALIEASVAEVDQ